MNSKRCPYCHCSTKVVKIGVTSSGRQRYKCKACLKTWVNQPRPTRLADKVWHDFVWNNMPARALSDKYKKHPNTIRDILHNYEVKPLNLDSLNAGEKAKITVIAMDTTYFGRKHGVVTIINAHNGDLLYFCETTGSETNTDYYNAFYSLQKAGIYPKACIIDGRKGVGDLLVDEGVLVQMCHFHMWQIVRRYLTNNPVLEPNIELKHIMDNFLSQRFPVDKQKFSAQIISWKHRNWRWLNEKHRNENGRLEWSHADTRRAYNAIISHAKWLFTYEKYPELNIPRTSNIIEGKFGNAKDKMRLHHGYTHEFKIKIFFSLLSGE